MIGTQIYDLFVETFDYFFIFSHYLAAKAIDRPVCGLICSEKVNIFYCFGQAVT